MGTAAETTRRLDTNLRRENGTSVTRHVGIRRILVCLDQSSFSDTTLRYATFVATTFDSAITLLFVLQAETTASRGTDACSWAIARKEASAYLERIQRETALATGLPVDWRIEQGHPAERIASLARELDADLIVLGSYGENGVTTWNLGATTQQVLAAACGSVLIARASPHGRAAAAPKRVLVPLDGSPRAESVLPAAARIAKADGAEILLAHVVADPSATAMLRGEDDLDFARELGTRLESSASRYLEGLRAQLERDGLTVRATVLRNADLRQSLLDLAGRAAVDLVLLSAHGGTCNPARSFGSVAAHFLAHGSVPILVLQDLPAAEIDRARERAETLGAPELRASFTAEGP